MRIHVCLYVLCSRLVQEFGNGVRDGGEVVGLGGYVQSDVQGYCSEGVVCYMLPYRESRGHQTKSKKDVRMALCSTKAARSRKSSSVSVAHALAMPRRRLFQRPSLGPRHAAARGGWCGGCACFYTRELSCKLSAQDVASAGRAGAARCVQCAGCGSFGVCRSARRAVYSRGRGGGSAQARSHGAAEVCSHHNPLRIGMLCAHAHACA